MTLNLWDHRLHIFAIDESVILA